MAAKITKGKFRALVVVGSNRDIKSGIKLKCPNCIRTRNYVDSDTSPVITLKYNTKESFCPFCTEMVENRVVMQYLEYPGVTKNCSYCNKPFESFWSREHFCENCLIRNSNQYFPNRV